MAILNPLSTVNAQINVTSGTGAINIGSDAVGKTITIGNSTGATGVVINTGSSGLTVPAFTTTGAVVSNASGLLTDANASTSGHVLTSNGAGSAPSFQAPSGSGTVNSGTANQITYYASNGTAVSGLAGANRATLVTNASGVPSMTASMTDGQVLIGSTSGTPAPATLTAGTNVTITNGAGSITISAAGGGGATWTAVTGTSATMVAGNGYIANNASLVTLTLPTTADVGSLLYIQGFGAGGWRIAQNSGQQVFVGSVSTTAGTSGTTSSANRYDSMTLVCVTANTTWCCLNGPLSAGLDLV